MEYEKIHRKAEYILKKLKYLMIDEIYDNYDEILRDIGYVTDKLVIKITKI